MSELDAYAKELAKRKFRCQCDSYRYIITDTPTGEQRYIHAGNANTIWANAYWPKNRRTQLEWLWANAMPLKKEKEAVK